MDQSGTSQNRRSRRSNLLMTARLEVSGRAIDVKLRNLSTEGALIEGAEVPDARIVDRNDARVI